MLKRSYLIFIVAVLFIVSCKKDLLHWQKVQQLNSNTSATINHLRFLNDSVCIAAGGVAWAKSVILRSSDGGFSWSSTSDSLAPKELFGMGVSSNNTIYLCGLDGDVLHSNNQGQTWQFGRIGDWLEYYCGNFISPDTGIFISGIQQRQSSITRVDSNFNTIDKKTYLFGLNNFYNSGPIKCYAIGYGTVLFSGDQGNTWNYQDVEGDNFQTMDIHGEEIWMCGYNGSVYHTLDGGNNWNRVRNGNDLTIPHYPLLDIAFKDSQNGWAVCDNGKIIHTDDAGAHWEEYEQFTTGALRTLAICPNGDLLTAGDNGNIFRLVIY